MMKKMQYCNNDKRLEIENDLWCERVIDCFECIDTDTNEVGKCYGVYTTDNEFKVIRYRESVFGVEFEVINIGDYGQMCSYLMINF